MSSLRDELDSVVSRFAQRYVGIAAAVVRDEGSAMTGRGQARESAAPPRNDTIFQIGSITKVFTSLLLAELVLEQEVALDEPLGTFFPEVRVPERHRPITLLDLSTHTAGISRLPNGLLRQALRHRDNPYSTFDEQDLLRALSELRPRRAPGSRVSYSNFGAALLGEAMSRRVGKPYGELVVSRICQPLGMPDTLIELSPSQQRRAARGHSRRGRPVPDWDMPALPGMGALRSTTDDLCTFLRAQLALPGASATTRGTGIQGAGAEHPGDVRTSTLTEAIAMTQQPRVRASKRVTMGLAWHRSPLADQDVQMWWHNGGTGGTFSFIGFVPERRTGVVVLTNCARSVDRLGYGLLRQLSARA